MPPALPSNSPGSLTPFLLIGLYAVRRGELGPRRALALTARYTATAALAWAAVNAYFAVPGFSAWLHGTLLPPGLGSVAKVLLKATR